MKQRILTLIASLPPVAFIIAVAVNLLTPRRSGWEDYPGLWYSMNLLVIALIGIPWFIHVFRTHWLPLITIISVVALIVVLTSSDWVVGTHYNYMGDQSYETYYPLRSPIWNPPTPGDCAVDARSWRDFFGGGGGGGPTEDPVLRLNLSGMASRLFAFTAIPYFILLLLSRHTACLNLGSTETP
jgi:hypothetical protein